MKEIYLRGCLLVYTLLMSLVAFAQDDIDDDLPISSIEDTDDFMLPIHQFSFSDIIMVILLFAVCYVLNKVWKGCSILLLIAAALIWYLS